MRTPVLAVLVLVVSLTACGSDSTGPEGNDDFIVRGSGSSLAAASILGSNNSGVDPSSFSIGFVEMRLSSNPDCSGPYHTVFSRSTPNRLDLVSNPEIARTSDVPDGSYPCAAMRISDLLRFVPSSTEGVCIGGVEVTRDTYRTENNDSPYRDIDGATITATGTESAPSEDLVWIFMSTNQSSVTARGFSEYQVITLSSQLVAPGTTTFYWDLSGAIGPEGSSCGTVGGSIGFR